MNGLAQSERCISIYQGDRILQIPVLRSQHIHHCCKFSTQPFLLQINRQRKYALLNKKIVDSTRGVVFSSKATVHSINNAVFNCFRLQKFKMTIANTVISQDNSSLLTMGTDQLLDLFALEDRRKGECSAPADSKVVEKRETVKAILEGLGELWDEQQYESEYDMNNFMKSLV